MEETASAFGKAVKVMASSSGSRRRGGRGLCVWVLGQGISNGWRHGQRAYGYSGIDKGRTVGSWLVAELSRGLINREGVRVGRRLPVDILI